MELFTRNSPYYHLLKYLLFLLKHPVYSEFMFVASGIRHVMHMRFVVMYGLPHSTAISTLSHKRYDFRNKLLNAKCALFSSITFVSNISHYMKNLSEIWSKNLYWSSSKFSNYYCPFSAKPESFWRCFEKYTNVKFNENRYSGNRLVQCG